MRKGGSSNSRGDGGGCFIATATMGDYNHPAVVVLRQFRDEYLDARAWGRNFVKVYYKYSPRAAAVIEKHAILRGLSYVLIVKPLTLVVKLFKA